MTSDLNNKETAPPPSNANDFIERQLDQRIAAIEDSFEADALTVHGPLYRGLDDLLRKAVETKCKEEPIRQKAIVVLTTVGGYIEVVHRMVDTLRHHYNTVEFIIPNYAYSAGTIFSMSGDAIHMDYYSRLGPIDPQVETPDGSKMVPALGYLEQYNDLIKKSNLGSISMAEMNILVNGFDQAELYQYDQQRELSIALLQEWLCKYKFKDWKKTRTRKKTVTEKMKEKRAKEIAKESNNTERWHSHGYGISMEVLEKDLNVRIDDFGSMPCASEGIRGYHDLVSDYMARRSSIGVIHFKGQYRIFR